MASREIPREDEENNQIQEELPPESGPETGEEPPQEDAPAKVPTIICPTFTKETLMVSFAADQMNKWFRENGFNTRFMTDIRARKPFVWRQTKLSGRTADGPNLIIYYGHGFNDSWMGVEGLKNRIFPGLRLIVDGKNEDWIARNNIVYAVACYTMNKLGRNMVDKSGALVYGGSTERINFDLYDSPDEDESIYDFVEVFNAFPTALGMGLTIGESIKVMYATVDEYLRRYEASGQLDKDRFMRNQYYGMKIFKETFRFKVKNKNVLDMRWV